MRKFASRFASRFTRKIHSKGDEMNIGQRLFLIRKESGLSQKDFAGKIGVSKGAVGSYETGRQTPGSAIIASVCKYFSIEPRWLLLGEGPMRADYPEVGADLTRHNVNVEAREARVKELENELERLNIELLAAQMERDRAKEDAYKAMKLALKVHGADLDLD